MLKTVTGLFSLPFLNCGSTLTYDWATINSVDCANPNGQYGVRKPDVLKHSQHSHDNNGFVKCTKKIITRQLSFFSERIRDVRQ